MHENYISIVIIVGMAILPHPVKVVGRGWGNILSPHPGAGRGRAGMGLVFLSPPRPCPALIIRTIILNLVNPKSLIFKVKHKTLDKIFFILNLLLLPLTLLLSLLSIHVFQF